MILTLWHLEVTSMSWWWYCKSLNRDHLAEEMAPEVIYKQFVACKPRITLLSGGTSSLAVTRNILYIQVEYAWWFSLGSTNSASGSDVVSITNYLTS